MVALPRLLSAVIIAGSALLWSAPAAVAATPAGPSAGPALTAPGEEQDVMRWTGTVMFAETESDTGVVRESPPWSDAVLEYRCVDTRCDLTVSGGVSSDSRFSAENTLLATRDFTDLTLDDTGTFSRSFPAVGDPCVEDAPVLPISLAEGTLTSDTAVVTFTTEEWGASCGGGRSVVYWSSVRTFEGVYVAGDPCVLAGRECEPEPIVEAVQEIVERPVVAIIGAVTSEQEQAVATTVSRIASGGAAAPSVLSALVPIQDSQVGLLDLCVAVFITLILSLLVALPKRLYSAAIGAVPKRWNEYKAWLSRRTSRVGSWWHAVLARPALGRPAVAPDLPGEPQHGIGSGPWRKASIGVVAAGVISAFVDPGFGLNWGSLRVALSLSSGFFLNVVVGWSVAIWIARRFNPGLTASYTFKPLSLLIVALAVFFTRLTGMAPGMVFGLVAGVALGAMASKAAEARVAVAQTGYAFALGVAGWLTYSAVLPALGGSSNVLIALFVDTLAGVSVAGFAAAPIALLPVAGMGGTKVFEWSPKTWFALYSAGLVGFFVVLMPMSYSWKEVDFSLKAWVALYVAYAAVALIGYLALVRPWERPVSGEGAPSDEELDVDDNADEALGDTGPSHSDRAELPKV